MQEEKKQTKSAIKIQGYIYLLVESFTLDGVDKPASCCLSLGSNAKCQTRAYQPGTPVNQVFLIQVPKEETTRLVADFKVDENSIGESRFDINPFFDHVGNAHTLSSDIMNSNQEKKGSANLKITYFSAEFGKLRIRVFHLSVVQTLAQFYKQAKLKIKIGIYAQSSPMWDMKKDFDQTLELLVLSKTANLDFEVVHAEGILARYTINNLQESKLLIDETKAYQVSLFNKEKAVGTIKYQVDWIKSDLNV